PAAGTPPSRSLISAASWSGRSNMRVPRPLQVNSSGPDRVARHAGTQQRLAQIFVGRCRVPDLELHGRADLDEVADSHRAGRLVRAGDRPDQKVAASEFSFVFVDGKPDVQAAGHQDLVLRGQVRRDLLENLQRWPPG